MGRCCVPNCRGNYDSGPKVRLFGFPSDPERRAKWQRAVRRDDVDVGKLKDPQVCERHFMPDHLRTTSKYTDSDGRTIEVQMKLTRLTPDAVPTIFPDCPRYLSEARQSREEPDAKRKRKEDGQLQKAIQESALAHEREEQENKIHSLQDVTSRLHRLREKKFWAAITCDSCVIFAHIETTTDAPELLVSVTVSSNLSVRAFWKGARLTSDEQLDIPDEIHDFRVLVQLLENVENHCTTTEHRPADKANAVLKLVASLLDDISSGELLEDEKADAVMFLKEQCHLLLKRNNAVRYSPELLVLCSILYTISPHGYRFLRSSGKIVLPHPATIKRVCATHDVSPLKEQNEEGFLRYMKRRASLLKPHERNVTLMVDEIHLQQFFQYKGGSITGAANNCSEPAKTAHVFMVQSLLSPFKDVVHILPVSRITAEGLHDIVKKVIMSLEDANLHVVAVITDNNSINRKVMSMFGTAHNLEIVYPHPANAQQPLFHIVDPVHLLKCVRNNWLNQKNSDKCFYYPPFDGDDTENINMKGASFTSLRKLYEAEQDNAVKVAYGLTYKALNPSNLERQNMKLALSIFNAFVSSALRIQGRSLQLTLSDETANFIDLIVRWWNIVNVKTPQKGHRLRDVWQEPVQGTTCEQLQYLDKFVSWLDAWKSRHAQTGTLTKETHLALRLTTYALIEVSRYCLEELGFRYVLLGKFQTDPLEARFGKYRQLCGSHYNVSITEVFEAEAKIRLQSTLVLTDMPESSSACRTEPNAEMLISKYNIQLTSSELQRPRQDTPALVYIAGYCAYAALKRQPCDDCRDLLTIASRELERSDHVLIDNMSRGGLKFPQPSVVHAVLCTKIVLERMTGKQCEHQFHTESSQRSALLSVMMHLLSDNEDLDACATGHSPDSILKNILNPAVNTLLKNYAACKNDRITREKLSGKQRKLHTLI